MPLRVGIIVEGKGEYEAIRSLLERVWYTLLGGDFLEVLRPFRQPQGTLLKEDGLKRTVDAVKIKLDTLPGAAHKLVLILIDSEGQCPKVLAPKLIGWAKEARSDADIACALPNPMFETWFVAAADSLAGVNGLPADLVAPDDPEGRRLGKSWLKKRLKTYNEVTDQPSFVARMDLALCRARSASFDKLCRELEARLAPPRGEEGATNEPPPLKPVPESLDPGTSP